MSPEYLPLEDWLMRQESHHFPENKNYFGIYLRIKEWLGIHIYPFIGAGAASIDSQFYNDHGPKHFDTVIKTAGKLVGICKYGDDQTKLYPYEVFILLVSILLHDAGMIVGRTGHEKKPFLILKEMGLVGQGDSFEMKQIALIADAHGGRTSANDPDTIGKTLKAKSKLLEFEFRPKLIAAILRFSDEICEDKTRAARCLLESKSPDLQMKLENQAFHKYAAAINSVTIDVPANFIKIEFHLQKKDLTLKFGRLDKKVYLVDEIFSRLNKMNCERLYCNRFTADVLQIYRIRVEITIFDEEYNEINQKNFDIEDTGFPQVNLCLSRSNPDWTGKALALRYR